MEDIYDNLENYEDVNNIHEIIHENKELKTKIEEYTSTIDRLQRDFDKLAAEHKKLELNYSSLLKTARAEIERKTLMIRELNIEKDKLIINARQSILKNNSNNHTRDETIKSRKVISNSSAKERSEEVNSKAYYKNDYASSAQSISNGKTEANVGNNAERKLLDKKSTGSTEDCISKEIDKQVSNKPHNGHSQTRLKRISNRRKSMPVLSNELKFSSDEDCENRGELEVINKNCHPKEEIVKRFKEKSYHSNRMSETSSIENYSRCHEPYTGNYSRNKVNCNRSGERYESSYRHREKLSPERLNYRGADKRADEYYQRYDYNRRRVYDSPPCEKSYYKGRTRSYRSEYGRDRSRDCVWNRNDDDRYAEKHKLLDNFDEPSYKRQKFEYGYRHTQDYNRWQREADCSQRMIHSSLELTEQLTCQSPDYPYTDNFISAVPIKEIRYTANEHLDDPRLTSKKYKVITDSDKEFLTTVHGRDVNYYPVDKIVWGMQPMPKALREPPENFFEQLKKNVNLDINNQTSNNLHKESPPSSHKNSNEKEEPPKLIETVENKSLLNAVDHKKTERPNLIKDAKLKYQKMNENCIDEGEISKVDDNIRASLGESDKHIICNNTYKDMIKKSVGTKEEVLQPTKENILTIKLNSMPQLNINHESPNVESYLNDNKVEYNYNDNIVRNNVTSKQFGFDVSTRIVEEDLILSDDTNDVFDTHQKSAKQNDKSKSKKGKDTKNYDRSKSLTLTRGEKCVDKKEPVSEDKKSSTRKHKSKNKLAQKKEHDSEKSKSSKTKRSKKEEDLKKREENKTQMKSKFSDLFGDSSSLITPDDLGIVNHGNEISDKYGTIFEDTQAAVDINLKELEKSHTPKESCQNIQNVCANEEMSINTHSSKPNPVRIEDNDLEKDEKVSIKTRSSKATPDSIRVVDNNSEKDEKQKSNKSLKNDSEAKPPVVIEMLSLNKDIRKVSTEPSDVVKTIVISTGMQPQSLLEDNRDFTQPNNVLPSEKQTETLTLHALATSTPAKVTPESLASINALEPVPSKPQDCSSSTTSNNSKVVLLPTDKSSHSQIEDVPDVRIFVKRKRKVKRVT